MSGQPESGQSLPFSYPLLSRPPLSRPLAAVEGCDIQCGASSARVWQRWRALHDDILNHVRACDRLNVELTAGQLAEELDEALGLVERRLEELSSLQIVYCHSDGRIELDSGYRLMCG